LWPGIPRTARARNPEIDPSRPLAPTGDDAGDDAGDEA
jgi:hypothetical protein